MLAAGSLSAVALISPDMTAARRFALPPYSFSTTSLRVSPSRCNAGPTMTSLSEPKVLTPTTPPFRSAAVRTPGAAKNVKRMTLASAAMTRRSPPVRLSRTTDDRPTCMASISPAANAAAPRLPPLMLTISILRPLAS